MGLPDLMGSMAPLYEHLRNEMKSRISDDNGKKGRREGGLMRTYFLPSHKKTSLSMFSCDITCAYIYK
jgi:hypothetical protein